MASLWSQSYPWEVDMIRERKREDILEAKKRSVYKGRPTTYTEKHKGLQYALELLQNRASNGMTVNEICEITKISRATIYRAIREQDNAFNKENEK